MPSPPTLKITGLAVAYPPRLVPVEELSDFAYKWHQPSPALDKVLAINRRTGIKTLSLASPFMDLTTPPSVSEVAELFRAEGVPLAVAASRNAVDEAGIAFEDITHVVATTCTTSSNPGFDCYVAQELGLRPDIERVLLHGVGCAGGLAALRLAASLCQSAAWRDEPAHVLVVACEITSSMRRAELEKISREQKVRVGITLFGDGSSALVLSLDYGPSPDGVDGNTSKRDKGIYELVNWAHLTVPDTYSDLRVEVTSTGFAPTLSNQIPALTGPCAPLLYHTLLKTLRNPTSFPSLPTDPKDFDWAMHPGGAAILTATQNALQVDKEHMKSSWEVYEKHGNTSSVTVLSVLNAVRGMPGREWVVSEAFGPGITAEGVLLRRVEF